MSQGLPDESRDDPAGSKPTFWSKTDPFTERPPVPPEAAGANTPSAPSDPEITRPYQLNALGEPSTLRSAADAPFPHIPGYEIEAILGRGGMGIVYKARHLTLNRAVALKMVRPGGHIDPEELARFKSEAQAAARLQHPNIVQIFEVGEHGGLPFCALELVEGGTLTERLTRRLPSPAEAAGLVEVVARAMHFAHSRNVIHRDLKPGNILLTRDGVPKVTDFGLARQLDTDSGLTRAGMVMGTPSYMAPEQASGQAHDAGPAADVYALGGILYAALTGKPPFKGATSLETLDQVRGREPQPPSRTQAHVPRDLETICLKCLAKEPDRRYASAHEFAEDLRRFQRGEPIRARPVGTMERLWRWSRRNPTLAALVALVHVLGVLGLAGIVWQWHEAVVARTQAQTTAEAEANAKLRAERTLADTYTSFGMMADAGKRPDLAVLWFAHAARQAGSDRPREEANRLRVVTWQRQAFQPVAALPHTAEWLNQLAFHPVAHPTLGSAYLLTETSSRPPGSARWTLWDVDAQAEIPFPAVVAVPSAVAWNPSGTQLALADTQGEVVLVAFDASQGRSPCGNVLQRLRVRGAVRVLAFSADGARLAVGGAHGARVWEVGRAGFVTPELAPTQAVTSLNFNTSGTLLAVAGRDHRGRLFAVPGESAACVWGADVWVPHQQSRPGQGSGRPLPLLFLNDARELLSSPAAGTLVWLDAATGKPKERRLQLPSWIAALASDRGGRHLAVSSAAVPFGYTALPADEFREDSEVVLLEAAAEGKPAWRAGLAHRPRTFMMAMTFNPAGDTLLTGCTDGSVQRWSVPEGAPLGAPLLHPTHVHLTAFAPDPRWIATAQRGGLVRIWKVPRHGLELTRVAHGASGSFARVSPDGKHVLPSGITFNAGTLVSPRVHDLATGDAIGPPLGGNGIVLDALFSPGGEEVVLARSVAQQPAERAKQRIPAGVVEFWNWRTGQPTRAPVPLKGEPRSLCFHPANPRVLAVLGADGRLLVVDRETGIKNERQAHAASFGAGTMLNNGLVRFSPDGQCVLTWGTDAHLRIWEVEATDLRCDLPLGNKALYTDVQFSPDGRFLLAGARDNRVRVWAWNQGRPDPARPEVVLPHPDWPHAARWSPDGKYLLTGCRDKQARLWDWRTGKLLWCAAHPHEVHTVAFTARGDEVLTGCDDKTLRVWDAATGIPLTPALPLSGEAGSLAVTPDGKYVAAGGFGKTVDVVRLDGLRAEPTESLERMCRWGEILSGQTMQSGGGTTVLTAEQWLTVWRDYRRRYPKRE